MQFKEHLLNEESNFFGSKIGNVLNAVHDLEDDSKNMGTRHLTNVVQNIINRIRTILQGSWSVRQRPHLEDLQKVGVALAKAIDEKGDIREILKSVSQELEDITKKLGTPVNQIGTDLAQE